MRLLDNSKITIKKQVQSIVCTSGNGAFTLSFRGKVTDLLPFSVNASGLRNALQNLPTVGLVNVTVNIQNSGPSDSQAVCAPSGLGN